MPLIPKPNYNQIFASQAPDIDKPAVFSNYPEGWGPESRPNNGKPTIKGFNYLQQTSDLKVLWILQNGACLPYDESIEYAEGAPVLKDGVIQYKTKSGFNPAISEKPYILKYFTEGASYPINARVMLDNGDIVKSTVANNTANPNVDMTGWVETNAASQIFDESGKSQQQINTILLSRFASIEDFGASESATREVNTAAINTALSTFKRIYVPDGKSYPVNLNGIFLNTNNYLFGGGELVGPDPDAIMADVSGQMIRIDNCTGVVVTDVKIKNGYKGKGVWMTNSRNIEFNNFTVDGYSYGMWIGENDDGVGCSDIRINKPRILNTRYWGIYVRCLNVVDEAKKTKNIWCEDPYFYNCNMAAFVCAEGRVSGVSLINPVFERCNVCMHFESTANYTVVNPRDYDTGKKLDHVPANTEYPYTGWSMYHAFCSNAKIIGGKLEKTCYHYAANGGGSEYIEYIGTTAFEHVFEGGGSDSAKVFFQNYKFSDCTTTGVFIYQLNGADNYLRNFEINDCKCLLGQSVGTGTGDGNLLGINAPRTVNFEVRNSKFFNCMLRISGYGNMFVTGNSFIGGTNNSQCQFRGLAGGQLGGDVLQFTGNTFERAGGSVLPDSAILIENFSVVRTDNIMRTTCSYGYRFTNNYRVEYGKSYVLGWTSGAYTETGTTEFVTL